MKNYLHFHKFFEKWSTLLFYDNGSPGILTSISKVINLGADAVIN